MEFTGTREAKPTEVFSWKEERYHVRHKDEDREEAGGFVSFPWHEPWLRPALEALDGTSPPQETLVQLGQCLREFLRPTKWDRYLYQIENALKAQRPVHLTIRSVQADELYYLPWELLPLSAKNRFVGMQDCLLQYETLGRDSQDQPRSPEGRILLAYASGRTGVPANEHLKAIRDACAKKNFHFHEEQDVLHEANRTSLAEKLKEQERPVTSLHLLCHGVRVSNTAYGLMLGPSASSSTWEPLDVDTLRDLLAPCFRTRPPRLVTLCACQGGDSGTPAHLLGSVARMFHQLDVPAVIASRMPLSCEGSIRLTETLYAELLSPHGNLRTALSAIRKRLREELSTRDWMSLQFYAHEGDEAALYPFSEPPLPPSDAPKRELVLIRHEAYDKAAVGPDPSQAKRIFDGRQPRIVPIDQTSMLEQGEWKNLEKEVKALASPTGALRLAFGERGTDVAYYGFPYVPLAVLAGYLAKTRDVYVFECVANRFVWEPGGDGSFPPLQVEAQRRKTGSDARLRLSISALVEPADCREVLPDSDVKLDLHLLLEERKRDSVRHEEQLQAYVRVIQEALNQYILEDRTRSIERVHIFAAIPVSIAFYLGKTLSASWLPQCFVYNYVREKRPRYKWRLDLRAAFEGRRSIKIFK